MKTIRNRIKLSSLRTLVLTGTVLICSLTSFASGNISGARFTNDNDTSVSAYMRQYLKTGGLMMNYPKSVNRFYQAYGAEAAWVNQRDTKQTWQAMMLLDCVLQYGLSHNDYHPKELLYDPLHTMIEEPAKISNARKAKFDILLTDALISLMNNMHYGKLNPEYSSDKIDDGLALSFHAETALLNARQQEKFIRAIESAQPHTKQYAAMQDKLRQLRGVYQADCYEVCEDQVAKIAVNMERLRWAAISESTYIQINIPSYTLKLYTPDTIYQFKVVVGKPSAPTPSLNSAITYLTTTPEWKVPQKIFINELLPKALKYPDYIANSHFSIYDRNGNYVATDRSTLKRVQRNPSGYYARQNAGCDENALGMIVFRFQNVYGIFLHDTPEQKLFQREERPFSHSCIRVERARDLAELVLKLGNSADRVPEMDKNLKTHRTRNISIRKAMPIKITYLTCEVDQGLITDYKDVYDLDKRLEMALYGNALVLTQNK